MENLEIQCDTGELVDIGTEIVTSLKGLNKAVADMGGAISKALSSIVRGIQDVGSNADMMADTLLDVNGTLANVLNAIQKEFGIFNKQSPCCWNY